uniref:Ig-like domain-containing protein n=1 Tax=Xenopus tropicalis TaxID=8364 RepID=A0A803K6L9_XENTR
MSLGYWKLLALTLLPCSVYAGSCGPNRNINGKVGGTATLPVNVTGNTEIGWKFVIGTSGNLFAETKPNSPISIRDSQYQGRIDSTTDGSLIFTHLTKKDQGTYLTDISQTNCDQYYSLRVYKSLVAEDIQIHHNRSGSGSCNIILSCTVNEEDVTITWSHRDRTDTEGPGPTLHVYNESDGAYTCTARNPVSSASRGLKLSDICNKGTDQNPLEYLHYLIGLILALLIVFTISAILFFVRKRRKKPDYQNTAGEMEGQSIYSQVEDVNIYPANTPQRRTNTSLTIYSQVHAEKGPERNLKNGATAKVNAETEYSVVCHPTQGPERNQKNGATAKVNAETEYSVVCHPTQEKNNPKKKPRKQKGQEQQMDPEPFYEQVTFPQAPITANEDVFTKYEVIKKS